MTPHPIITEDVTFRKVTKDEGLSACDRNSIDEEWDKIKKEKDEIGRLREELDRERLEMDKEKA